MGLLVLILSRSTQRVVAVDALPQSASQPGTLRWPRATFQGDPILLRLDSFLLQFAVAFFFAPFLAAASALGRKLVLLVRRRRCSVCLTEK